MKEPVAPVQTSIEAATRDRKKISRSISRVGIGSLLGLVAGLASQVAIAYYFGAGRQMDAFLTALTIPLYLDAVLLSSLSFVFIPIFVEYTTDGREEEAWALVGTFFWLLGITLVVLSGLISFFAPQVIGLIAPDLAADKAVESAQMLAVVIWALPFTGYAIFATGVQNARDSFFWPAARSAVNSLANLAVMLLFFHTLGAMTLVWAYIAAEAAAAAVTMVPVIRHGWRRLAPLNDPRVIEMAKLVVPLILLGVVTRITPIFERYFASGLPDGDLSYLGYSNKLSRIFQGLLGSTVATAIFPVMAKAFAKEGEQGLLQIFKYGTRLTLAVGMPLVALVSALAVPLVVMVFERGRFTATDTFSVALILPIATSRTILFFMLGNLMVRVFYSTKDTRTVPIVTASAVVGYIALAALTVDPMGYMGLAIADTAYSALGVIILGILILRRYKLFTRDMLLQGLLAYLLPSVIVFAAAFGIVLLLAHYPAVIQVLVAATVTGLLYMGLLLKLDNEIAWALIDILGLSKLGKLRLFQRLGIRLAGG